MREELLPVPHRLCTALESRLMRAWCDSGLQVSKCYAELQRRSEARGSKEIGSEEIGSEIMGSEEIGSEEHLECG